MCSGGRATTFPAVWMGGVRDRVQVTPGPGHEEHGVPSMEAGLWLNRQGDGSPEAPRGHIEFEIT